jgi:hypothetical protein
MDTIPCFNVTKKKFKKNWKKILRLTLFNFIHKIRATLMPKIDSWSQFCESPCWSNHWNILRQMNVLQLGTKFQPKNTQLNFLSVNYVRNWFIKSTPNPRRPATSTVPRRWGRKLRVHRAHRGRHLPGTRTWTGRGRRSTGSRCPGSSLRPGPDFRFGQGDQMRLWKKSPKLKPNPYFATLSTKLFFFRNEYIH